MTKIRFILLLLCISTCCTVWAQPHTTTITISNLSDKPNDAKRIESNLSKCFTELLRAYSEGQIPNFDGIKIDSISRSIIMDIWQKNSPFRLRQKAYERPAVRLGDNKCYRIMGLEFYFKNRKVDANKYEEYQVTVEPDGKIVDFLRTNFPLASVGSEITEGPVFDNIMHFVEMLATAHSSKDLAFLQKIYSDNAIIITGKAISKKEGVVINDTKLSSLVKDFEIEVKSKAQYIQKLTEIFRNNSFISVEYIDIRIRTHPTKNEKYKGIYYVSMKQLYRSSTYNDDGYLTLVWNFKEQNSPEILLRAWFDKEFDMRQININLPND